MPAARVRSSIVSKSGTMSRAAKDFPSVNFREAGFREKDDGEDALVVRHADDRLRSPSEISQIRRTARNARTPSGEARVGERVPGLGLHP
jgi:hypothetical protein